MIWLLLASAAAAILFGAILNHAPVIVCDRCGASLNHATAHTGHEDGCGRAANGWCRCDLTVCGRCCMECAPRVAP